MWGRKRVRATLASRVPADFPRVNIISILAGVLALISVILPWWGITSQYLGNGGSVNWSLWGSPYIGETSLSPTAAQPIQNMGIFNLLVLGLVFVTAALVFLGSFAERKTYLIAGFVTAISTLSVYAGTLSYTLIGICQATPSSPCISGPVGSAVFPSGDIANWGFQSGFYLSLVGGVLTLFAVIFHQYFLQRKKPSPA